MYQKQPAFLSSRRNARLAHATGVTTGHALASGVIEAAGAPPLPPSIPIIR